MLIIFFIIGLLSGGVKKVKLTKKTLSKNKISFVETSTIRDDDEGFYKSIDTAISPDGKVVVFDRGNFLIHVFDSDGKKINEFGKEGNGPGELSGFGRILAFEDRIVVKMFGRLIFFNYSGHLIRELKDNIVRGALFQSSGVYIYMFDGSASNEFVSKTYDKFGKVIEEVRNPNYKSVEKTGPKSESDYFENIQHYMQQDYNKPVGFEPYKNGYIRVSHGDYNVELLDKNLSITHTLSRDYVRKKIQIGSGKIANAKKLTKSERELEAKKRSRYNAALIAITGGYRDAIEEIAGSYNGYLFLTLDDGEPYKKRIDVISPSLELISIIDINDFGLDNVDEFRWATIKRDKLVLEMVSDEYGPYVKIYDIKITEEN